MIPAIRQVCEVMSLLVLIISHLKPNMGIIYLINLWVRGKKSVNKNRTVRDTYLIFLLDY